MGSLQLAPRDPLWRRTGTADRIRPGPRADGDRRGVKNAEGNTKGSETRFLGPLEYWVEDDVINLRFPIVVWLGIVLAACVGPRPAHGEEPCRVVQQEKCVESLLAVFRFPPRYGGGAAGPVVGKPADGPHAFPGQTARSWSSTSACPTTRSKRRGLKSRKSKSRAKGRPARWSSGWPPRSRPLLPW